MIFLFLKYYMKVMVLWIKKVVVIIWFIVVFFVILLFIGVGIFGYEEGKCFYYFIDMGRVYVIFILFVLFFLLIIVLVCCIVIKFLSLRFILR